MTCYTASIAALATAFGAANSLATRDLFQLSCDLTCNPSSITSPFSKPVYASLIGFLAMALSVPVAMLEGYIVRRKTGEGKVRAGKTFKKRRRSLDDEDADVFGYGGGFGRSSSLLLSSINNPSGSDDSTSSSDDEKLPEQSTRPFFSRYIPLILPSLLDCLATALQAGAVLFISAGINASLRGTLLFFAAIFAVLLKSKEQNIGRIEQGGILLATIGATLVGVSAVLDSGSGGGGTMSSVILGCGLSLSSNIVQGLQVAIETKFIEKGEFSALELNGAEGVIGSIVLILCLVVFALTPAPSVPGVAFDNGHIEDSLQTICCLSKSSEIVMASISLLFLFAFSTGLYILLSKLSGNLRAFCMVARAIVVWAVELALSALPVGTTLSRFGAPWLEHSYIAAIGSAVLLIGGLVTWHGKHAREDSNEEQDKVSNDDRSENDGKLNEVLARLNKGIGALEMVEFKYRGIE
jgi:hypothetical protein